MSILINLLLAIHVIVSLLIILLVLMQRPKNEGLGAAFGGGMTENLFGAQTTNVLANITRWLGAIFFILSLSLSVLYVRHTNSKSKVQKQLLAAPMAIPPAVSATPLPDAAASATPASAETAPATPEAAPTASPAPEISPAPSPANQ
jgi:preprotein translocase subunit SecG